ncbi:uncharacterized protein LOC117610941 [Osmia lignaria lignaria]|uniref:uncharacterized protein LOC117610941 n=1 Tax=Osmia lignaria lignaria TaxID=1437193 RepID=UPI00402BAEED
MLHFRMILLLLISGIGITTGEIKFTPLNDASVFIEKQGKAHLFYTHWKLIVMADCNEPTLRISEVEYMLNVTKKACSDVCLEAKEILMLEHKLSKVKEENIRLKIFLGIRNKRGLLNFVGSVSKNLFGTLDEDDLKLINQNMDKLFEQQNVMSNAILNQTHIIKTLLKEANSDTMFKLHRENFVLYHSAIDKINNNSRNIYMNSQLIAISVLITEIENDVRNFMDAMTLGRSGIVNPSIVKPKEFVQRLEALQRSEFKRYSIDLKEENYQILISISSFTISIVNHKIAYVFEIPLIDEQEWEIKRLYPIPTTRDNIIYTIPVIPHNTALETNSQIILSSQREIEKFKRYNKLRICKQKSASHPISSSKKCESEILQLAPDILKICPTGTYYMSEELTYIELESGKFIVIPRGEVEIQTLCKEHSTITIRKAHIVESDESCILTSTNSMIKIGKVDREYTYETRIKYIVKSYDGR